MPPLIVLIVLTDIITGWLIHKMKNSLGFTLIELMISISILAVFITASTVYFNDFNSRQKLNKAEVEVESAVKMASNYAKIRQSPVGDDEKVIFVELSKNVSGKIVATVNGVGATYFASSIVNGGVIVSLNPSTIYFWGGNGKLAADVDGNFYDADQTARIVVSISEGVAETRTVIINSLGNIQ